MKYDLIVVGGGAAGFFGAIQTAEACPGARIVILEKSNKLLSKVKISGGGRCNVTHNETRFAPLSRHYPRGEKFLKRLFKQYAVSETVNWFSNKGIQLKTEADGRMFPVSDSSQTIIECFLTETSRLGMEVLRNHEVVGLEKIEYGLRVKLHGEKVLDGKNVLVSIGGHPQRSAYVWLEKAGHTISQLIPSLFTFNDPAKKFAHLMGLSVPDALVKIEGTKYASQGPVLITHWGLSGPAVIKLSAWAAEHLHQVSYTCTVLVSWVGNKSEDDVRATLNDRKANSVQRIHSAVLFELPQRLWKQLSENAGIPDNKTWKEASNKEINRLTEQLIRCRFDIRGKTTFKEEFVTCGGIPLNEINNETMQSLVVPGLYFAGEVLNIDGETGGFNFQAAWSTAWSAAQHIGRSLKNK